MNLGFIRGGGGFWGLFVGFGWVFGCGGVCFGVGCVVMACLKGFYAFKQQVFQNPLIDKHELNPYRFGR